MHTSKTKRTPSGYITSSFGAVVSMTSSECNFSNCIFDENRGISDNSVTTGPFCGCAIYANSSSILNVKLCNFTNNLFYEIGYQSVNTGLN